MNAVHCGGWLPRRTFHDPISASAPTTETALRGSRSTVHAGLTCTTMTCATLIASRAQH